MTKELHVVVLPWLAFGHIMPFLELSIALAKSGVRVSFISTPKNIQRLPSLPLPPESQPLLRLVPIPLPAGDGLLPQGAEASVDLPFHQIPSLKISYDLLRHPLRDFVAGERPDWLIVDFAAHWAADIARDFRAGFMRYGVFTAASDVFFGPPEYLHGPERDRLRSTPASLTHPPEWFPFPSLLRYARHDAPYVIAGFYGGNASGVSDTHRLAKVLEESQAIAVRTCPEIEGEYLTLYQELLKKPVIPVGLIPPEEPENITAALEPAWAETFEWLDRREPGTVVFVGFGSECKLSKEQTYEIAHGLELSGLPFLWVLLRKPEWAAAEDGEELPEGFGRRTAGRGRVCVGWAPQKEILAHPSVGGSLFHAGWGSAIETLRFGNRMVVLPFIADQPLNARLLVEKGLAVEVEKGEDDGSFRRESVAESLRKAMVGEEGEELKARTMEAAAIVGNMKLHQRYMDGFVEYLKENAVKKM